MHATQAELLSPEGRKALKDSMTWMVWDVNKASSAVMAMSEMMQEYIAHKEPSLKTIEHIEYGMWLCGELGNHQKQLLERLESALNQSEFSEGPESLQADRPEFSDSLSLAARSVSPEGI
ncbi:MAG: hypothetical protein COB05_09795 [Marinobacter sp.]|nr:MAG: hypothetical protein COB05_09795 [Marinobacter sp.]